MALLNDIALQCRDLVGNPKRFARPETVIDGEIDGIVIESCRTISCPSAPDAELLHVIVLEQSTDLIAIAVFAADRWPPVGIRLTTGAAPRTVRVLDP